MRKEPPLRITASGAGDELLQEDYILQVDDAVRRTGRVKIAVRKFERTGGNETQCDALANEQICSIDNAVRCTERCQAAIVKVESQRDRIRR